MTRRWRKKIHKVKKTMNLENIKNGELPKKQNLDEETIEPVKFTVRKYRPRFVRVTAYKLPEDSKIHCCDGTELTGLAGDFYVCLDDVHELVISSAMFRKLFLLKTDDEIV